MNHLPVLNFRIFDLQPVPHQTVLLLTGAQNRIGKNVYGIGG